MQAISNKGSILLGIVIFLLIITTSIYMLAKTVLGATSLVQMEKQDIKLELGGLSGIARAAWLINNNKEAQYKINIHKSFPLNEKISLIKASNSYQENIENTTLTICFSSENQCLYVLVSLGKANSGYEMKRLYTCEYEKNPFKPIKLSYN
ncbi:MAG: hypothetical protein DKM50_03960 [Candidatus Margulisiibacteriota bacterium]|nr:MAG: hypothetical protein A2X43_01675 [Candidatus Margulisbacteria bacterium GWD2_39_127]OGI05505.1 MAG: hypothetical protein A2X42_00160 [Candidatus Margulisbacteria bacterium GWF2_38_17]OGI08297.1 MAG: hypothetical protein A2X41_00085 [Candidatus Margulisbacteria bacterium GWE2_39_32]PZM82291.1 MAG: hypothetical protein DKM50_03960 [Candidatus Margulisiibacteriota bacterium]HAR62963.1 hypothetical protein [Candidatus Margulisiibacteriota bacterium]